MKIKQKLKSNLERYGVPYVIQSYKFLNKSLKLKNQSPYNENLYYQLLYSWIFLNKSENLGIIDFTQEARLLNMMIILYIFYSFILKNII